MLTAVGLDWDRPEPAIVPASGTALESERLKPAVPTPIAFRQERQLANKPQFTQ